mmetsp:Transcript_115020/g.330429  ORF Transcript_115020/g.330429 Transcript_115020/m.330429 type:complete len:455 (+) Transcript_115020:89-1453(+)
MDDAHIAVDVANALCGGFRGGFSLTDAGSPRPSQIFLPFRHAVSGCKRRFRDGEFDLDLSYVTPRLIGMGYPSRGLVSTYRNPAVEVSRFLESRHAGHYKVYNLCSEREEDFSQYFRRVERFPFNDHNPCPMKMLTSICRSIEAYLSRDPANVAAVHCKAGKGRTGLVIAAYLIHVGICASADEALGHFASARTVDGKGVTIPSQIRYVRYYEELLWGPLPSALRTFRIRRLILRGMPGDVVSSGSGLYFKVRRWEGSGADLRARTVFNWRRHSGRDMRRLGARETIGKFDCKGLGVCVRGDVQIAIFSENFVGLRQRLCSFWFNTAFCKREDALLFSKVDLDGVSWDKKHQRLPADFAVQVFVSDADCRGSRLDEIRPRRSGLPGCTRRDARADVGAFSACTGADADALSPDCVSDSGPFTVTYGSSGGDGEAQDGDEEDGADTSLDSTSDED